MEQLELELKKLNLRVGNVELKNNDQDDAIMFLKTRRDATFSIINQTEEPRHHHSYYESNNKTDDYFDDGGGGGGKGTMRQKRPFRLLPVSQPNK